MRMSAKAIRLRDQMPPVELLGLPYAPQNSTLKPTAFSLNAPFCCLALFWRSCRVLMRKPVEAVGIEE